jgi:hypothetical protein
MVTSQDLALPIATRDRNSAPVARNDFTLINLLSLLSYKLDAC